MTVILVDFRKNRGRRAGNSSGGQIQSVTTQSVEETRKVRELTEWFVCRNVSMELRQEYFMADITDGERQYARYLADAILHGFEEQLEEINFAVLPIVEMDAARLEAEDGRRYDALVFLDFLNRQTSALDENDYMKAQDLCKGRFDLKMVWLRRRWRKMARARSLSSNATNRLAGDFIVSKLRQWHSEGRGKAQDNG